MSDTLKHTPGPWFVEETPAAGIRVVHGDQDSEGFRDDVIIRGTISDKQALANARLIAAAPEMLDALKHIAKYGKRCDVRWIAQTAIKKAEGVTK